MKAEELDALEASADLLADEGYDLDHADLEQHGASLVVGVPKLVDHIRELHDQHHEHIAEWQTASGLLRGGDPGGVTPEDLAAEMRLHGRLLIRVRDWIRGEPNPGESEAAILADLDKLLDGRDG